MQLTQKTAALMALGGVCALLGVLLYALSPARATPAKLSTASDTSKSRTPDGEALSLPERQASFTGTARKDEAPLLAGSATTNETAPLENTRTELAYQIDASLDGILHINSLLDQMMQIAEKKVSPYVDFDYEEDEAVAYNFLDTTDRINAHFLVGLEPFERDEQLHNYFEMEIIVDESSRELFHGAIRKGQRVHLVVDYDSKGRPGRLALITQRDPAMRESRKAGIDAYKGIFTTGANYQVDLSDPKNPRYASTYGIVDGSQKTFPSIPLQGDLGLDPSKITSLFTRFQSLLETVKGK